MTAGRFAVHMAGRVAPGLESLLDPRSVALVGASRRTSRWGFLFVRGMEQGATRRNNYYISRSVDEPEAGWYPSIEALPEVPELVVLLIGNEGSRQQIELCLELGSKAVISVATPFTGRDDPLLDRIAEAGMVVLGPNTMGLVCTHTRLDLAPPLLHGERRAPGRVAVVSQSGTVSTDLALELYARASGCRPSWAWATSTASPPAGRSGPWPTTTTRKRSSSTWRTRSTAGTSGRRWTMPGTGAWRW